ncbi:hypothetical protein C3L33_12608, partial [Rhododendron williamsianum]
IDREFLYQIFAEVIKAGATTLVSVILLGGLCWCKTSGSNNQWHGERAGNASLEEVSVCVAHDIRIARANATFARHDFSLVLYYTCTSVNLLNFMEAYRYIVSGSFEELADHEQSVFSINFITLLCFLQNGFGFSGRHALRSRLSEVGCNIMFFKVKLEFLSSMPGIYSSALLPQLAYDIDSKDLDDLFWRFKAVAEKKKVRREYSLSS